MIGWTTRRRSALAAIGLTAALGMTLAACGGGDDSDSGSGELTFVAFGGTTQDAMTKTMVDPFAQETGIKVTNDQPNDYAKIKAMVDAGKTTWDVVDADVPIVMQECGTLFEKIDKSKIDTSKIPDNLDVTDCGVPNYRTGVVLYYNTEAYADKPAPDSWDAFFDTKTYPGKRAIGADPLYVVEGVMKSIVHDNDKVYPIDFDKVFAKLDTIKSDLVTWNTGAEAVQMMSSKQVNMIITWPGRASAAVDDGAPYAPVWNASVFAYDVWAIPKGAAHVDNALKFINYAVGAKPQSEFAKLVAYAPINTDATVPDESTTIGKFAMTFDKQDKYDVLQRNQQWWADNWDMAHDKFSAWSVG